MWGIVLQLMTFSLTDSQGEGSKYFALSMSIKLYE